MAVHALPYGIKGSGVFHCVDQSPDHLSSLIVNDNLNFLGLIQVHLNVGALGFGWIHHAAVNLGFHFWR